MKTVVLATAVAIATLTASVSFAAPDKATPIPAAKMDIAPSPGTQTAVLAGGCFWGMEAVFERVKGVRAVTAGYSGGQASTANYPDVSSETTKHAEAIRIVYDPRQVSYATLLRVFFSVAEDPTELNRQGPDTGTSYRSAIFAQSSDQARVARAYISQLGAAHAFKAPIVTRIEQGPFFPAEAYHQHFYDKNPSHPYIVMWDKPMVAAFRAAYPQLATKA